MPDKKKKILIIDDETDLCLLLRDFFRRKNYEVSISHSLSEGLKLFYRVIPDVLVLDNNLPDGIGWEAAPEIAGLFPATYIVLVSAFHPAVPQMPLNAHYRALEKPISLRELDRQFATL